MDVRPLSARPPTARRDVHSSSQRASATLIRRPSLTGSEFVAEDLEDGPHEMDIFEERTQRQARVATLDFGTVFKHHAPRPPAPPIKLPDGVQNSFLHPNSFPRRRPASHRGVVQREDTSSFADPSRQRPKTARVDIRAHRAGTAGPQRQSSRAGTAGPQRQSNARTRDDANQEGTQSGEVNWEHRGISTILSDESGESTTVKWSTFLRNKRYTARPISRVETAGSLIPAGVKPAVLEQHLGEYELQVNKSLHPEIFQTDAQVRFLKEFTQVKRAIVFQEPLPEHALPPGIRATSPVKWKEIEHPTAVAKGERLTRNDHLQHGDGHGLKNRDELGNKRMSLTYCQVDDTTKDDRRMSVVSTRPSARPQRGKYAMLYPPARTQLRPESGGPRAKHSNPSADMPASLALALPPPPTVQSLEKSIVGIASAVEENNGFADEEGLGTFLTQIHPLNTCRPLMSKGHKTYVEPVKPKWEHLDPNRVDEVINAMPLMCDGRLVMSSDVKHLLQKRQHNLRGRVLQNTRKSKPLPASDLVQRNVDHVKIVADMINDQDSTVRIKASTGNELVFADMNPYKQRELNVLHERAELMSGRRQVAEQRRKLLEDSRKEETLERIRRKALAMERKAVLEEQERRDDLQRHLLVLMAFGFKTSVFFSKVQRWHEHKPGMLRRRWAVLVIEKYYRLHKKHQFSKKRAQALFSLACVFQNAIRRWRARHVKKKADIIIAFIREMRNYGKIQVAVKRFRVKIVHAQNLIRRSIVCNQARYQLLEMQWDKVDIERRKIFGERRAAMTFAIAQKVKQRLEPRTGVSKFAREGSHSEVK